MNSVLQSDIFFFITTICIVLVSAFLIIVLYKTSKILANIEEVSNKVKESAVGIHDDVSEFRMNLKNGEFGFKDILSFFIQKSSQKKKPKV